MDKNFEFGEVERIIKDFLGKYGDHFPEDRREDIIHYFDVGEYEFAFEYIMLEVIERNIIIINDEKIIMKKLAFSLKMNKNECNDDFFWEKFSKYMG
jgi:hypothetical protein